MYPAVETEQQEINYSEVIQEINANLVDLVDTYLASDPECQKNYSNLGFVEVNLDGGNINLAKRKNEKSSPEYCIAVINRKLEGQGILFADRLVYIKGGLHFVYSARTDFYDKKRNVRDSLEYLSSSAKDPSIAVGNAGSLIKELKNYFDSLE